MWEFLFNSLWGWIGVTGIVVIACGVIAWFIPPLRNIAIAVGGMALAAATIYAKGNRDRAALERRRRDEAVRRNQEAFDAINKRPDTPDDVDRRLSDGKF